MKQLEAVWDFLTMTNWPAVAVAARNIAVILIMVLAGSWVFKPARRVLRAVWRAICWMWRTVASVVRWWRARRRAAARAALPRDPRREFTAAQIGRGLYCAGYRCEHVEPSGERCQVLHCADGPLHADHIEPWIEGGATSDENRQMLCRTHNLSKHDERPTERYLVRLTASRAQYWPEELELPRLTPAALRYQWATPRSAYVPGP